MTRKKTVDSWNQLPEVEQLREVNRILLRRVAELEGILNRSAILDELRVRREELKELREEVRRLTTMLRKAGLA
jgi:hypothetical protein